MFHVEFLHKQREEMLKFCGKIMFIDLKVKKTQCYIKDTSARFVFETGIAKFTIVTSVTENWLSLTLFVSFRLMLLMSVVHLGTKLLC